MKRIVLALLIACPGLLGAQQPFADHAEAAARNRRATREKAVAHAGPSARPLVECEFGDDAARALLNCTKDTATRLAESHAAGGFARVVRAREIFGVIARQKTGDEVGQWVMEHAGELTDPDAVAAFIEEPITYVLALKKLSVAATERRAVRIEAEKYAATGEKGVDPRTRPAVAEPVPLMSRADTKPVLGLVAAAGLIAFGIWWKRRAARA